MLELKANYVYEVEIIEHENKNLIGKKVLVAWMGILFHCEQKNNKLWYDDVKVCRCLGKMGTNTK